MNILIISYTITWVYRLYEEYIISLKKFIEKNYNDINIDLNYYDIASINHIDVLLDLNIDKYNKILYSGNIDLFHIIKYKFKNKKIYYINIEQLSHMNYYKYIKNIDNNSNIIDYSEENIPFLNKSYNTFLIPPYYENININKNDKNIDILSIINNDYRKNIYDNIIINDKYNKIAINNCYDEERNDHFNKTKIYVNIHCSNDHNTMELIRLVNLITRKVIIISQKSICNELLFLNKYIIVCNNIEDFSLYIQEILINYDTYFNKFYGNFDKDYNNYISYIKTNIDKFLAQ
jgi:hypothetical protein